MNIPWDNKKLWILLGIVVVIILAIIALRELPLRSSRTVMLALTELGQTDSLHANTVLKLNLPERLGYRQRPFTAVDIVIDGDMQRSDTGVPELAGTVRGEARGLGNTFFVDGDLRLLQDAVSFRLDNLPILLNPSGSLINKWTYVDTPLLVTNNGSNVAQAVAMAASRLTYQGRQTLDGQRLAHYAGQLSAEDEQALADAFRLSASGNQALHVVARLLDAHNVRDFQVWLTPSSRQLHTVQISFVRPLRDGGEFDFATLTLSVNNFGEPATIDRPERKVVVSPGVFSRLFGSGDSMVIQQ